MEEISLQLWAKWLSRCASVCCCTSFGIIFSTSKLSWSSHSVDSMSPRKENATSGRVGTWWHSVSSLWEMHTIRNATKYPSVSNCWVWHFTGHHTSECLLQTGQLTNSCCQFLVLCLKVCPTNPHLVRWSMPNGLTLRYVGEIAMTSASKSAKEKDPSFFLQGWTGDISSSKSARLFSDFEGSW